MTCKRNNMRLFKLVSGREDWLLVQQRPVYNLSSVMLLVETAAQRLLCFLSLSSCIIPICMILVIPICIIFQELWVVTVLYLGFQYLTMLHHLLPDHMDSSYMTVYLWSNVMLRKYGNWSKWEELHGEEKGHSSWSKWVFLNLGFLNGEVGGDPSKIAITVAQVK